MSSHSQLLEKDKILLIVDDRRGDLAIYLESLAVIHGAVERHRPRKTLKRDKIGTDFLLAFDESKRMLSVCASTKVYSLSSVTKPHSDIFDVSYNFTCFSSTNPSLLSRPLGAL